MRKLLTLLTLLLVASIAGGWIIKETKSNEDVKLYTSPSGTPTLAMTITGSTGNVSFAKGVSESTTNNATTGTISDLAWTTPIVHFTGSGAITLTGVVAQANGTRFTVHNDTGFTITFAQNTTSSTLNRFLLPSAQDITLAHNGMATFVYGNDRWRSLSPDYSEGTWTPTVTDSDNSFGTVTYDAGLRFGRYTRNGKLVCIQANVAWTNTSTTPSGSILRVGGLPFTSSQSASFPDYIPVVATSNIDIPAGRTFLSSIFVPSVPRLDIIASGDNVGQSNVTGLGNGGATARSIQINGCYTL